jgi:hypothetical protein
MTAERRKSPDDAGHRLAERSQVALGAHLYAPSETFLSAPISPGSKDPWSQSDLIAPLWGKTNCLKAGLLAHKYAA